jgi:hypothetical protein
MPKLIICEVLVSSKCKDFELQLSFRQADPDGVVLQSRTGWSPW